MKKKGKRMDATQTGKFVQSRFEFISLAILCVLAILSFSLVFLNKEWNSLLIVILFCSYCLIFLFILHRKERAFHSIIHENARKIWLHWSRDLLICSFFAATAFNIGYFFLTANGPGLSPDSLSYITTGENVHNGIGFNQMYGYPMAYSFWPPLYPILISFVMNLGLTAEAAARLITVSSFALLLFPLFFLCVKAGNRIVAYATCVISLVFYPFWLAASFAWTEMPFLLFSVSSVFFITYYLERQDEAYIPLFLSAVFAALAALTKYIGLTVIIAAVCIVLYKNRSHIHDALIHSLIFVVVSSLPIGLWFYRNLLRTGILTGQVRGLSNLQFLDHIVAIPVTTAGDILGPLLKIATPEGIILLGIAIFCTVLLFFIHTKTDVFKNFTDITVPSFLPILTFILVYTISLVILKSAWDRIDPIGIRFMMPVYPFILLMIAGIIPGILKLIGDSQKNQKYTFLFLLFICIFVLFYSLASIAFLQTTAMQGQGYNDPVLETSEPLFQWIKSNVSPNEMIFIDDIYMYYINYKFRVVALNIIIDDMLNTANNPEKVNSFANSIKSTNLRMNFVFNKNNETAEEKIIALREKLRTISTRYNLSFEYFETDDALKGYSVIRVGPS